MIHLSLAKTQESLQWRRTCNEWVLVSLETLVASMLPCFHVLAVGIAGPWPSRRPFQVAKGIAPWKTSRWEATKRWIPTHEVSLPKPLKTSYLSWPIFCVVMIFSLKIRCFPSTFTLLYFSTTKLFPPSRDLVGGIPGDLRGKDSLRLGAYLSRCLGVLHN